MKSKILIKIDILFESLTANKELWKNRQQLPLKLFCVIVEYLDTYMAKSQAWIWFNNMINIIERNN